MSKYKFGLIVTDDLKLTPAELHATPHIEGLPSSIDYRNFNGSNWTGPVRDQDGCGSCVAHSGVKVCAVSRRVADQASNEDVEMSAYDLFSHGGSCGVGWTLEAAGSAYQKYGACPEKCWDDDNIRQACCSQSKFKIIGTQRIASDAAAKDWIANHGAVWAAMDVPESFTYITDESVYHDDGSAIVGSHAVCLCGYDDTKQAWLLMNSWSEQWGASGFCWIGYGECGLLRKYASYGIKVSNTPPPNCTGKIDVYTRDGTIPLSGSLITLDTAGGSGQTNESGHYVFENQCPNTVHKVNASHSGYLDTSHTVTTDDGGNAYADMLMLPVPDGDIIMTRDGTLSIELVSRLNKRQLNLYANDINVGNVSTMRPYTYAKIGQFERGEAITFKLMSPTGVIYHNVIVYAMGTSMYLMYLGTQKNKHEYVFLVKVT